MIMSEAKINAAKAALAYVKDGMCIGLGSGSTVREFIKLLGEKAKKGMKLTCVTTSFDSRMLFAYDVPTSVFRFFAVRAENSGGSSLLSSKVKFFLLP